MAVSEASVVMDRRGWTSMVASEMVVFTWLMAVIISGVMVKSFLALDRESVRGRKCGRRVEGSGGRNSPSRGVSGRLAWRTGAGAAGRIGGSRAWAGAGLEQLETGVFGCKGEAPSPWCPPRTRFPTRSRAFGKTSPHCPTSGETSIPLSSPSSSPSAGAEQRQ